MSKEKYYIIGSGLGGGYGGIRYYNVIKVNSLEEALDWAEEEAKEEYQSYEGSGGLRDVFQIAEEDELDAEDAEDAYKEEVESWIVFSAIEYSKEEEDKVKYHHYQNDYESELKEIKK